MSLTTYLTGTLIPALKANDSGRIQWGDCLDEVARLLGEDPNASIGPFVNLGTTGGTGTAYTIPNGQTPSGFALNNGILIAIKLNATNGAAPTLNINSLGAKKIVNPLGESLVTTILPSGRVCLLSYDSAFDSGAGAFVLLNSPVSEVNIHQEDFTGLVNTTSGSFTTISSLTQALTLQSTDIVMMRSDIRFSISDGSTPMQVVHYNGSSFAGFSTIDYNRGLSSTSGNVGATGFSSKWSGLSGSVTFSVQWARPSGAGTLYSLSGQLILEHIKYR